MVLLPENSDEFCDDWIEEERLEIDIGLSEDYEYLRKGKHYQKQVCMSLEPISVLTWKKKISICVE